MIEIGLALWIVAIGALATIHLAAVGMPYLYAAVIVPAGYAIYVIASLVLTAAERFSAIGALTLASVAAGTAGAWAILRKRSELPWRRIGFETGGVLVVAVMVAALAQVIHLTRLTPDSMTYLISAGALERTGGLAALDGSAVLKRLLVVPVLEAPGALTGRGYVASLMPLFGVAAAGLTGRLAHAAIGMAGVSRRVGPWLLGTAGLFLFTTNRFVFNFGYIHTHMVFAVFLLLGVGLAWLALQLERWEPLSAAALGFAALPMIRAEAFIIVAIFLVPILTERALPAQRRWVLAGAVAATTVLWFGIAVPPRVDTADLALTGPVVSNVIGAAGLLGLVAATQVGRLQKIVRFAPAVVAAGLAGFVALRALRFPELLQTSVAALAANLAILGGWGTFWFVSVVLFVLGVTTVRIPGQRLLTYPIASYPIAVLAFVFLRDGGYREGTGDSGNRMMMHIALIVVVYLVAAAAAAAAEAEAEEIGSPPGSNLSGVPPATD